MSQQKVSDYFSTKKRARQEDSLTSIKEKDKRLKSCEPAKASSPSHDHKSLDEEELTPSDKKQMIKEMQKKLALAKEQLAAKKQQVPMEGAEPKEQKKKPNVSSVNELKERIKNFNQNLTQHTEKHKLRKRDDVSVRELLDARPQEDPAFIKYSSLASTELERKLVLPTKYTILSEMFKGTDTTIKFLNNRQEICTFLKLKNAVQNMTKKNFTTNNLGQIKSVLPEAYIYKQEKMYIDQRNDYHLTIAADLSDPSVKTNENGVKVITPQMLLERLDRFKIRLIDMVKHIHEKFLKSIGVLVDLNTIKRWHPKFDLEQVPDIEAAELPTQPNEVKCKSGEDLISIAKDVYSVRVKNAIDEILIQQKTTSTQTKQILVETQVTASSKKVANFNALLDRVRAKERQKELENMVKNSDGEKRLVLVEKYTESVRFVKSYFSAEKKSILELDCVCLKLSEFQRAWTPHECEQIIRELSQDFSHWLSIVKVRQTQYVKIDKMLDINEIFIKINSIISTLKC